MVEYDKYCLRYRYFFILKKFDKIIFYLFGLMGKNLKLQGIS